MTIEEQKNITQTLSLLESIASRSIPKSIEPKQHELIISGRSFTLIAMNSKDQEAWVAMRTMTAWRMVKVAQELNDAVILARSELAAPLTPQFRDQEVARLSQEIWGIQNILVFEALHLESDESNPQYFTDTEFVFSLSYDQKITILEAQDTLNAQGLIAEILSLDVKRRTDAMEEIRQEIRQEISV